MSSIYSGLELSAVPAITAAVLDWATVTYVLPALGLTKPAPTPAGVVVPNAAPSMIHLIIGWLIQAVAIFAGIVLGNMINNAIFRR
jgi:hypothetical protein